MLARSLDMIDGVAPETSMVRQVLVIEDDVDIAELVAIHVRELNCQVTLAHDGPRGLELAQNGQFNLVILDLMLPGIDGLEITRRLRARTNYTPLLMLTSRSSELERVLGLEMGADDYLTKPFSVLELSARVKAILRRMEKLPAPSRSESDAVLEAGPLRIDVKCRSVEVQGEPVDLTAKEFDLLLFFAQHPGHVYSREQLLNH